MGRIVIFVGRIVNAGKDPKGEPRYAIYIPKKIHNKILDLVGKEIIIELKEPD